jgi:hypothetical protein
MEGLGVTNFALNQPSHGYTAETTEFDEALIQRGVVTRQQALIAKGATPQQAQALLQQKQDLEKQHQQQQNVSWDKTDNNREKGDDDDADDDSFVDDDDDGDFMDQYRQQRMREMKQAQQDSKNKGPKFDEVIQISRPEWQRHVNDSSLEHWVVVCLTSSDVNRTGRTEAAVQELATLCTSIKFVTIPSSAAIENWPQEHLPTLFAYRHGKMQHQFVSMPIQCNAEDLYQLLKLKGVVGEEKDEE